MPRGFFFFEQRDSGRASKIVTLAGPFLQAVAHALQTESEVGSEDQGLFNHLVGTLLQKQRHVDADCRRGLQIDHQFEFCGLLDGQVRRLGALQGPMKFLAAPAFLAIICIATPTQAAGILRFFAAVWVLL